MLFDRGLDVHLVTHDRVRDELTGSLPQAADHMHFTVDRRLSRLIGRAGSRFPRSVNEMIIWPLMGIISGLDQVRQIRSLTRGQARVVVHEPAPVSPRQPSLLASVGAPVVIGPLNGGMAYPAAFVRDVKGYERVIRRTLRFVSHLTNVLIRGKANARVVLVANERTRQALPANVRDDAVQYMVENGVDERIFSQSSHLGAPDPHRFLYVGRLIDWKRIDILLSALHLLPPHYMLDIVGDGPMRGSLEQQVSALGLQERVHFHGFLTQQDCADIMARSVALVLPSIYECGGAVVLEAMAMARPVIATDWGGPQDYISDGVHGILIPPNGSEPMVRAFADAMTDLGGDADRARTLGANGRQRIEQEFGWSRKIDRIIAIYQAAL